MLIAVAAAAIEWLALARRYPALEFVTLQRRSFARLAGYEIGAGLQLAAAYLLLMLLYLLAMHVARRPTTDDRRPRRQRDKETRRRLYFPISLFPRLHVSSVVGAIWLGWALQVAVLVWVHPGESLDIYEYIFRGHMVAELHISPLTTAPHDLPLDWLVRHITWWRLVDSYGPVWEAISGATTLLGSIFNPDPNRTFELIGRVLAYRGLAVAASAGCGALIYRLLQDSNRIIEGTEKTEKKKIYTSSAISVPSVVNNKAPLGLLLWLWNPLGLLVVAVGAHNDALMLLLVLLGARFLQHRRPIPALLLLLAAAHIKVTALLFLPAWLIWTIRRPTTDDRRKTKAYVRALLLVLRPSSFIRGTTTDDRRKTKAYVRALLLVLRPSSFVFGLTLLIALPISWLLYKPFGGWESLTRWLADRAPLFTTSLGALFYTEAQQIGWDTRSAARAASLGATALFGLAALPVLWRIRRLTTDDRRPMPDTETRRRPTTDDRRPMPDQGTRRPGDKETKRRLATDNGQRTTDNGQLTQYEAILWRAMRDCALLYLLLGAYWFQEWYLLWALAPAALVPTDRTSRYSIPALSLGALWSNLVVDFLSRGSPPRLGARGAEWVAFGTLVGPIITLTLIGVLYQVMRRAGAMGGASIGRSRSPDPVEAGE
jgi:hypothetical protein